MTVEPNLIIHGTDQIGEASGELTEWNKITPAHVTARINLPRALILRPSRNYHAPQRPNTQGWLASM
jgi:hypothetical protein